MDWLDVTHALESLTATQLDALLAELLLPCCDTCSCRTSVTGRSTVTHQSPGSERDGSCLGWGR